MPNLTTKELSAISEQLSNEKNLVAKFTAYANETSDPALKAKYEQVAKMHQGHYDLVYAQLN